MKAIVKTAPTDGPSGTEIREAPRPVPGEGEVLIRVAAAAVCGTDKHIYHWDPSIRDRFEVPRIYGHEFCGFVEDRRVGYLLPDGADASDDVSSLAFGDLGVSQHRLPAADNRSKGLEVESARDRHDGHDESTVDVGHQGLEYAVWVESENDRRLDTEIAVARVMRVLMLDEVDASCRKRHGGLGRSHRSVRPEQLH